ncbi:heparinase II/III domain-containing protein [Zobellia alginiliquefaciens]|uniref:heparinase II/III domain-containing protein n=1 Tax=Zobellia alginiliquefaciens TaxID=3032586 RepID=UPI0023E3AFEB|nr:heparinase II/III family protein [Zobellia alginiliquefaciens]
MQAFIGLSQTIQHPRIYITNQEKENFENTLATVEWKKELVDKKKQRLEKYIEYCKKDPEWLVSRLQMNWKTKHDKVFLREGNFSHSEGEAPVPTVRYSGTRDWASEYMRPSIEEVEPYFDDPRGLYLKHKKTGKMEWVHPSESGFAIDKINEQIMALVADAAFLYWLTGEKQYADFASPVFFTYMEGMYHRDAPIDLANSNQQHISGLATFEVIHEGIVVSLVATYDFLYNYFKRNRQNLDTSVAVFQKWGDQIIKKGIPDNNWNLFQARFLTYIGLVLEKNDNYKNGKGQEYFLDHTFNISTDRQIAIKESLLVYDQENAMWPECASYSVHVITTFLKIFTLLDHATNANEFNNYPMVERAALASFQYLFPSGYMVGFGDSHHKNLPPENFELLIANYRKYGQEKKEKLISGLLSAMVSEGLYDRKANGFFELFFYVDDLKHNPSEELNTSDLVSPTFYAPNVSMVNQRMGDGKNAVMASTVGSYGNHAHANGISLELYANNYAIGPDMGRGPSYWHKDHRDFYSRFPAHNTVVVDGKSDYAAMRTYFPFTLDHVYPKSGEETTFDKVTFSKVSFVEPKTVSDQQRFTALIKSTSSKPYILDVFWSKKQKEGKQKHEYIYHNLGQSLEIFDADHELLKMVPTDDLSSKKGDLNGYNYFFDKRKTVNSGDIKALFTLKSDNHPDNFMKLWVKGSHNQTLYNVNSPKSNALSEGTAPKKVLEKPIPTLILKREEAAWQNPFALVFNPYLEGEENPISNVSFSTLKNYPNTQIIKVLSHDEKREDHIVLNSSDNDVALDEAYYQKGLLSIIRQSRLKKEIQFMFLAGMTKFESHGWDIVSSGKPFSFSLENIENGYIISNDNPITINMPISNGAKMPEMQLYENGKLVSSRRATVNRNDPGQVVFKLTKGYKKIEIIY